MISGQTQTNLSGKHTMTNEKLKQIIDEKNERLERDTVEQARQLIEAIATEQRRIKLAEENIAEHRQALKKLEVQQVNPVSILGE